MREFRRIGEAYGEVVDAFIAKKKTNSGEMFGFLKFDLNVDVEKVVTKIRQKRISNRWIFASPARFARHDRPNHKHNSAGAHPPPKPDTQGGVKDSMKNTGIGSSAPTVSYAEAVKGTKVDECVGLNPTIIPPENCCMVGKVLEPSTLANLYVLCMGEGFIDVSIRYLGGLWALFEFKSPVVRDKFKVHMGVNSWFSSLVPWTSSFVLDERIVWVDVEGIPFHAWGVKSVEHMVKKWGTVVSYSESDWGNRYSVKVGVLTSYSDLIWDVLDVVLLDVKYKVRIKELCTWTPKFVEPIVVDIEDKEEHGIQDEEQVNGEEDGEFCEDIPDTVVESGGVGVGVPSADPFGFNDLLHNGKEVPEFPPGFSPKIHDESVDVQEQGDENHVASHDATGGPRSEGASAMFVSTTRGPRHCVSLINELNEMIELGEKLGLDMSEAESRLKSMFEGLGDKPCFQ